MLVMAEILIGYDPSEKLAYDVFEFSLRRHSPTTLKISPVILEECRRRGLFWREFEMRDGRIWDVISEAPCSTTFSLTRFCAPFLSEEQWVGFYDCDMLCMTDINRLFGLLDDRYAVMATQHVHLVTDNSVKMGGQIQTAYSRKNWSSCFFLNKNHPANAELTLDLINRVPGRDLHNFCWLQPSEIGSLPLSFNHLVGYPKPINGDGEVYPAYLYDKVDVAHFTSGMPWLPGFTDCEFADEWRAEVDLMEKSR